MTVEHQDSVAKRALDLPRLGLNDLAQAAGRSRTSIEKYRVGEKSMPEPVRKSLAAFLEEHARQLRQLAKELRRQQK